MASFARQRSGSQAQEPTSSWHREPPPHEIHRMTAVNECQDRAMAAGHKSATEWWQVDMADLRHVEALAQRYLNTGEPLDMLCNNAGVRGKGSASKLNKYGSDFIHQLSLARP